MLHRNRAIAENFGKRRDTYDRDANLQKEIARKLVTHLPESKAPRILEIGCGTGFLTKELFKKYPDGTFDITDLSQNMLNKCEENTPHENANFFTLDGENANIKNDYYDLIASSMTFQWFETPIETLQKLSKHAPVYFSSLGKNNFFEWKETLKAHNITDGTLDTVNWPNIIEEEFIKENNEDGKKFFKYLKSIGAAKPKDKYTPEKYAHIKKALNNFDGAITWHIIYGHEPLSR